ncbi:hypothetical protein [Streptomyces sp. NPDC001927]
MDLTEQELAEAMTLMDVLSVDSLDELELTNQYREALVEVIEAKAEHRAPAAPEGAEAAPAGQVVDLMAALEDTVARAKQARSESGGPATLHEMPTKKTTAKKASAKETAAKEATAQKTAPKAATSRRRKSALPDGRGHTLLAAHPLPAEYVGIRLRGSRPVPHREGRGPGRGPHETMRGRGGSVSWQREGFESHEGEVGALLADGSEPGPVYFDTGSRADFHESTSWYHYDGEMRRPTAVSLRARCACGWRGEEIYVLDWEKVREDGRDLHDTSGPLANWSAHMDQVAALRVPLPEAVTEALAQLRKLLDELVDDQPLTALRAAREMEQVVTSFAPYVARIVAQEDTQLPEVAEALGVTEKAAHSCLSRFERMV